MKVFISHKDCDSPLANFVAQLLSDYQIDCYLDVLDDVISSNGKELTEHIQNELSDCTDILVVLTRNTARSWWVPFEIGVATEKGLPTVTYMPNFAGANDSDDLPDYLSYWPCLRTLRDLIEYIRLKERFEQTELAKICGKQTAANRFYSELKRRIA